MKRIGFLLAALVLVPSDARAQRAELLQSIDKRAAISAEQAHQIWLWAESGYQEKKSAALLADMLAKAGFKVERGVAGIPTAFTASFGEGQPVIGILGEYDALPAVSQDAVPVRQPRPGVSYGHACGHHLFGVASASACIALAEQIRAGHIQGTIRYYGCPAEEGGAAKVFMVRAGLFKDCDVVLHWHPASRNSAGDQTCLSRIAVKFRFHGTGSHASAAPERGRSALDAVELCNHAAQLLREHTPDFTRIHHTITFGGGAANVVPDLAEVFYYIRHPSSDVVAQLYPRLRKCAEGAALATETRLETIYLGGTKELLPNDVLSRRVRTHLTELNDLKYTDEERRFAIRIQETLTNPPPLESIAQVADTSGILGKGSTDVGDVSWVVPTVGFSTATWVPGTPGHSWQAVAAGGMSIGHKGMQLAAKVLAVTAWDLFHEPKLIAEAKAEHQRKLANKPYKSLLLPGQEPPFNFRDPPKPRKE